MEDIKNIKQGDKLTMAVFNEDMRVKIPATNQFMRLGYDYQYVDFNTRIFMKRFMSALEK